MATINEASSQSGNNDKAAGLIAAIGLLSGEQTYTFILYKRIVLPVDGFVFYVEAQNIAPGFPIQQSSAAQGVSSLFLTPAEQAIFRFQSMGSLHLSQETNQEEDSTYVAQTILFTTKNQIENFARIAPDELYILTLGNGSKIAFNSQNNFYQLAGLWHYRGRAVFSTLATQIIDDPAQLAYCDQIVSNSLPLWLAMSQPCAPIYPSYLSPLNLTPPYITADITKTEALGQSPVYSPTTSQSQIVTDTIVFTTYGLSNNAVMDFQTMLLQNSEYGDYGIMNMPVPVDEKKVQSEFQIIAQKKTMLLRVNYYQSRARQIARRYIESAFITLTPVSYIS